MITCDECKKLLDGTSLVVMDKGTPTHYFCNRICKKDFIRVNGKV